MVLESQADGGAETGSGRGRAAGGLEGQAPGMGPPTCAFRRSNCLRTFSFRSFHSFCTDLSDSSVRTPCVSNSARSSDLSRSARIAFRRSGSPIASTRVNSARSAFRRSGSPISSTRMARNCGPSSLSTNCARGWCGLVDGWCARRERGRAAAHLLHLVQPALHAAALGL